MEAVETGQDWKIAALTFNFHVHFLFGEMFVNIKYMKMAYEEALVAYENNEVPVGAVIVKNDEVIARTHNSKEINKCAIFHAEMIAIETACHKLNNWRLNDCDLYVTLAPCPMCASAIKQSRIKNVYCGLSNSDEFNMHIVKQIFMADKTNNSVNFIDNIYSDKIQELLKKFFELKRH